MINENCYCGSAKSYSDCCGPFLDGFSLPKTAEQLMRSRYTAFILKHTNYIKNTMVSPALDFFDEKFILNSPIIWKKLEVLDKQQGESTDEEGIVLFKAYYKENQEDMAVSFLEERSIFKKIAGKWFYVTGETSVENPE